MKKIVFAAFLVMGLSVEGWCPPTQQTFGVYSGKLSVVRGKLSVKAMQPVVAAATGGTTGQSMGLLLAITYPN